jgi:AraC-like DNA-binding protein
MLNGPTALAMTLVPLRETLPEYGLDFAHFAHLVGIDPDLLSRPNARCPSARVQRLWRLAASASGDPLFGLRTGAHMRPGIFHALGLGIVSSTSVLAALRRIERYSSIVSTDGRFVLVRREPLVSLETRSSDLTVLPGTAYLDAAAVAICRILSQCAGPSATPLMVRLPHDRPDAPMAPYREAFGCPVEFDAPEAAFVFDAQAAAQAVLSGNPDLAAEADRLAARYMEGIAPDTAAARVRAQLLKAMPAGDVDQQGIARALNQSTSTLQRRLREEGTSYQQLLDATRRELALDYLKSGRHSLADITFLLGFADQSNFTRAFRRWTGKTPRQYLSPDRPRQQGQAQNPTTRCTTQ